MQLDISNTYEAMCRRVFTHLVSLTAALEKPFICPASGSTPEGLYRQIVAQVNEQKMDISHWEFVGLDEWVGMNGSDEGSCRQSLNEQFFGPLKIDEKRICFFDGCATNLEEECRRTERFIRQRGGIDVAIVGLGMNGHIAMNEPGTDATLRSHISDIAEDTQQVGQKYFTTPRQLAKGITLGIATLMESRHVLLMANGIKKAAIVKQMLTAPVSEALPATLFRNHPSFHIYLDKDAAAYLQRS